MADRSRLEEMTLEELRKEAARNGLSTQGSRGLIRRPVDTHMERQGPTREYEWSNPLQVSAAEVTSQRDVPAQGAQGPILQGNTSGGAGSTSERGDLVQVCAALAARMEQQQQMINQLLLAMTTGQRDNPQPTNTVQEAVSGSPGRIELNYESERTASRDLAIETMDRVREYNKIQYDLRHKKPSVYKPGDYVLIRSTVVKPGENSKLKPNYKGPYMVSKVLNNNRYVIKDIPGFNITSKPYNTIISPDRMKHWVKPINNE
ncbi:hypothetical protein DMN91_008907 [Ooceraea biroi]|uniref:SAP domain-containing protein n=1 Tax=Ooceraea biroi TaxID=2015173 RepID=A0A3L8DDJ2_OOCBI|nr:hypothetical protein DMN91_008907 [Ooceraea biroi]